MAASFVVPPVVDVIKAPAIGSDIANTNRGLKAKKFNVLVVVVLAGPPRSGGSTMDSIRSKEIPALVEKLKVSTVFGRFISVSVCKITSIEELWDHLESETPDLVHVYGNGSAPDGHFELFNSQILTLESVCGTLERHSHSPMNNLQAIILAVSHSRSALESLSNMAPTVLCMLAFQGVYGDTSMAAANTELYRLLAQGKNYADAFSVGCRQLKRALGYVQARHFESGVLANGNAVAAAAIAVAKTPRPPKSPREPTEVVVHPRAPKPEVSDDRRKSAEAARSRRRLSQQYTELRERTGSAHALLKEEEMLAHVLHSNTLLDRFSLADVYGTTADSDAGASGDELHPEGSRRASVEHMHAKHEKRIKHRSSRTKLNHRALRRASSGVRSVIDPSVRLADALRLSDGFIIAEDDDNDNTVRPSQAAAYNDSAAERVSDDDDDDDDDMYADPLLPDDINSGSTIAINNLRHKKEAAEDESRGVLSVLSSEVTMKPKNSLGKLSKPPLSPPSQPPSPHVDGARRKKGPSSSQKNLAEIGVPVESPTHAPLSAKLDAHQLGWQRRCPRPPWVLPHRKLVPGRGQFVGRTSLLLALRHKRVVVVCGNEGAGKTRLVHEYVSSSNSFVPPSAPVYWFDARSEATLLHQFRRIAMSVPQLRYTLDDSPRELVKAVRDWFESADEADVATDALHDIERPASPKTTTATLASNSTHSLLQQIAAATTADDGDGRDFKLSASDVGDSTTHTVTADVWPSPRKKTVRRLSSVNATPHWYIVFDDALDRSVVEPFLPTCGGQVLMTTSQRAPGYWDDLACCEEPALLEVGPMERHDSLRLLAMLLGDDLEEGDERDALEALASQLNDHALSLHIAAATMRLLGCRDARIYLQWVKEMVVSPACRTPVKAVVEVALERLAQYGHTAVAVCATFLSWFAPSRIPVSWMHEWRASNSVPMHHLRVWRDSPSVHEMLTVLHCCGLVDVSTDGRNVSIASSVQRVLRWRMPQRQQSDWASVIVSIVSKRWTYSGYDSTKQLCDADVDAPHVEELCAYAIELYVETDHLSKLLADVGDYFATIGALKQHNAVWAARVSIQEERLGVEHAAVAWSLVSMCLPYVRLGDMDEAARCFLRAVTIRDATTMQQEHERTRHAALKHSRSGSRAVTKRTSLRSKIKKTFKRERDREARPQQQPGGNITASQQETLADAIQLYESILFVLSERVGDSEVVASVLHQLGLLEEVQRNHMQAKDYFERAVNVRVALDFDADYAPLAESMKRMAALLEMMGDREQAESVRRCLSIDE